MTDTLSSVAAAQEALIDEFAFFDDWMERYQHLMDLGRKLEPMSPALCTDATRVNGCQSQVWLHAVREGDRLHLRATSDSTLVTGLIAVLLTVFNQRTPQEILDADVGFLAEIGLDEHLSANRRNGLNAMIERIRAIARDALA